MRISVTDKYLDLVRGDAKYFAKWLEWSGTEVTVLKPKKEAIEAYVIAYGAQASTFSRTPEYYTFHKGYISIDSLDFGLKENVQDQDAIVYLPDTEIDSGDLLQFERVGKRFTYQIEPLQNYQNFVYRSALRLIDVEELKNI